MGSLVREMAPGAGAQTFYSLKPVHADDVLNSAQLATKMETERLAAEAKAEAEDDEGSSAAGSPFMKALVWIVMMVVVAGLSFACSGPEDDDGSSGSARSNFHVGGGHGGK